MTADLGTLATAVSIAMDAFSVSVCMGICHNGLTIRDAAVLGGAFGAAQFGMPMVGALIAGSVTGLLDVWAPLIGAGLIMLVAMNMLRGAYLEKDRTCDCMGVTLLNVLVLALATSIDALIVGFSIKSSGGSELLLSVAAGAATFLLSFLGALGGGKLGEKIGTYAGYAGGTVLVLVALNIFFNA